MAIGLSQVNKANKKKAQEVVLNKEKTTRPWEAVSANGGNHGAIQAVKKAREIVHKNNVMVEEIRSFGASETTVNEVEQIIQERHDSFDKIIEKKSEELLNVISHCEAVVQTLGILGCVCRRCISCEC